jgi:dethiobiotin synthetase
MDGCNDVSRTIVVTGTDTDVGKTVFCAGLAQLLDGAYWKPVQAGLDGETDSETVRRLSGLARDRIHPEVWRLRTPASPHWAAELDQVAIDPQALRLPDEKRPLIVEGVGGLMVPLTRRTLLIDVLARWGAPVVLCARTRLGTINHTLLSIQELRRRAIPLLGVAFIGQPEPENARIITTFGSIRVLGCLPHLDPLTPDTLSAAFAGSFARDSFGN